MKSISYTLNPFYVIFLACRPCGNIVMSINVGPGTALHITTGPRRGFEPVLGVLNRY